ncbi:MAG TPA: endonuclease/exonuclease/phosphatase family protein [Candidatus Polarisedimenticolaceae bacterium]|nr:endonuclease/exonuclease/phosphatase family protein [Candidatus Polarisedimenticolaceae bacterium]
MQLKVLTYNIHRAIGVDRRFRPQRIVEILAHHDADLVLLQEVDEGVPRSRELDLAKDLARDAGYPHLAAGYNVSLRKGRYGNAILSRWPLSIHRNIDLTVDGLKRRGCLHARIGVETPQRGIRDLDIFNLHLGLQARERTRQVGMLAKSAEFNALPADAPCLVAGDFNDWLAQLHPVFLEIFGFKSAIRHRWGYQAAIRTYPAFSPTGALDKIYYRGPIRFLGARSCRLAVSRVASDHLPVIAEFELI